MTPMALRPYGPMLQPSGNVSQKWMKARSLELHMPRKEYLHIWLTSMVNIYG